MTWATYLLLLLIPSHTCSRRSDVRLSPKDLPYMWHYVLPKWKVSTLEQCVSLFNLFPSCSTRCEGRGGLQPRRSRKGGRTSTGTCHRWHDYRQSRCYTKTKRRRRKVKAGLPIRMKPFFERRPSWMMWVTPVSRGFSRSPHKARGGGDDGKRVGRGRLGTFLAWGRRGTKGPVFFPPSAFCVPPSFSSPSFFTDKRKRGLLLVLGKGERGDWIAGGKEESN